MRARRSGAADIVTTPEQPKTVPRPAYITVLRDALSLRMTIGTVVVVSLGLGVIALSYTSPFDPPDTSWLTFGVREIGAGLLVVAIANVVLQVFIERYRQQLSSRLDSFVKDDVTAELQEIRTDIAGQTHALLTGSTTLAALGTAGVSKVYASRGDATADLKRDIEATGLARIRIMGISLNDFLRSDQHQSLHSVWKVITHYVRGDWTPAQDLDVRVLIIDPQCYGAMLRSYGEAREDDQLAGRLDEDVKATAERLLRLVNEVNENKGQASGPEDGDGGDADVGGTVSFDFRIYRLPPTMFICSTDRVSYVQPYYFWSRRQFEVTMPLLRLEGTPLHAAMADHFDLVWERASVSGTDWLQANQIGIDKGAYESGVVNVFTDPATAYRRMRWLIEHATRRVWIQGISLKSFFEPGRLYAALHGALNRTDVDVRILLLDPRSEAARHRSFREHEFSDHCARRFASFADYASSPACHTESTLVRDTETSIKKIVHSIGRGGQRTRLYDTAPSCFVLMVDDDVLVEQYHFGKAIPPEFQIEEQGTPPILGKEMGLVEYSKEPTELVEWDSSRHPYDLLESHLSFVYDRCSLPLPLDDGDD